MPSDGKRSVALSAMVRRRAARSDGANRRAVCTDNLPFLARVVGTPTKVPILLEELRRVSERPMIIRMTTRSRPNDAMTIGSESRPTPRGPDDLHGSRIPRSARGWLGAAPRVVVSLEVADLTEPELRQEILKLRRRVEKLAALLRLALALIHTSGFSLSRERLPEGEAKQRILTAVDRAREFIPLRAVLRFLHLSPSRFQVWRRRQTACALDDRSSCPRTSPHRLTPSEVQAIGAMVTSPGTDTSRPARSPSSRSGWAACQRRRRPGTASSGGSVGDARGSACIQQSRRRGYARRDLTRCGTSTPLSSACSTGTVPIVDAAMLEQVVRRHRRRVVPRSPRVRQPGPAGDQATPEPPPCPAQ